MQQTVFTEELLKRDFKGDTPLHTAAKAGSQEVLAFYLTACTPAFLQLQNDFGLTPYEAVSEKISILEDRSQDKESSLEEKDKNLIKIENLLKAESFIQNFSDYITP